MTTTYFDNKNLTPNNDFAVIEIIDNADLVKSGSVFIAESAFSNEKLAHGKILAVGTNAKQMYGLEPGQYCLFDRLSTFYHTAPVCVVRYDNVILMTNESRTEYRPVKGSIFVRELEDNSNLMSSSSKFVYSQGIENIRIGKITDMYLDEKEQEEFPFKIGDTVMLVKKGDAVNLGGKNLFIYKPSDIIVRLD